jgi:hypothetical protein
MILGLTGCQRTDVTKSSPASEGEVKKAMEKKKVILDEPLVMISDYVLNQMDLKSPVDLRQIADQLSEQQRSEVEKISIVENGVNFHSFKGAESFKKLRFLRVDNSKIESLGDLQNVLNLDHLTLVYSKIDSLDSFPKTLPIEILNLDYCPLEDVGDLSHLSKLTNLSVSGTNVIGLDGNKLPHSLRYLGLRETKFKSLRAIESTFPFVETIDLSHSAIESVDDVGDFGHVKEIDLFDTPAMEKFRDKEGNVPQYVEYKGIFLVFVEPGV